MSVSIIYGVFCSYIEEKILESIIEKACNYDKEIKTYDVDFENSEDLNGTIIGIKIKELDAQYTGAMDITKIESKVTDEIKNKINNMVIETKLFNYIESFGKIWIYLDRNY